MPRFWRIHILILLGFCLILNCTQFEEQKDSPLKSSANYVGNGSCQSCHQEIHTAYLETGMGHAMYLPTPANLPELVSSREAVYDDFTDFHYQFLWENDSLYLKEFRLEYADTTYIRKEKIDYVIGSGKKTRSFLIHRNGFLYETPITWYSQKRILDLSPGYENGNNSRFSREISPTCISCHTGEFSYIAESKNRYREISLGIDCERCHGPGSDHIENMKAGETGNIAIINPSALEVDLQFDICQQCHLEGVAVLQEGVASEREFQPGMRLANVADVFLVEQQGTAIGIGSHAERLRQSQCFIQSEGKLVCTTCHDPHVQPDLSDQTVYTASCTTCHQESMELTCTAPEEELSLASNDCIQCHMPVNNTSDIPHVSIHDHLIQVPMPTEKSDQEVAAISESIRLICATTPNPTPTQTAKAWLSYYQEREANPVYLDSAKTHLPTDAYWFQAQLAFEKQLYPLALENLQKASSPTQKSIDGLYLKGQCLEAMAKLPEAYEIYQQAYAQYPNSIEAGIKAATTLLKAFPGQQETLTKARAILQDLYSEKPFDVRILNNLGFVALNQGRREEARFYLEEALRYDPDYVLAKQNLGYLR
ncbi:MAG: tetratricopeptide repeat protein [Bacteroidota bacterium]